MANRHSKEIHFLFLSIFFLTLLLSSCNNPISSEKNNYNPTLNNVLPLPNSINEDMGTFTLTSKTDIFINPANPEIKRISNQLRNKLHLATGFDIEVKSIFKSDSTTEGNIYLLISESSDLEPEGYHLNINDKRIQLSAEKPVGLFRGIQTIRHLFSPKIESQFAQPGPWVIATGTIEDSPYLEWRGSMLDVARHFFTVEEVKKYIDWMAYYKMNKLHLHLTDDQGWRIVIQSWPKLASYGGQTEVGGGLGGYYTQNEYAEIVSYAKERFITIIPEIDMPGHTNAALASYPKLNCDGKAPPLYTGIEVGFSSLCVDKNITYEFVNDVIGEIANITPGPYIHIGGDETWNTSDKDYIRFINKVHKIIHSYDKHMIGWEEIGKADISPSTIAQHWSSHMIKKALKKGSRGIMSPASKAYLDMKYNENTTLGLEWAGYINTKKAYNWHPKTHIGGISKDRIIGIEAPLWTENIATLEEIEYMTFPRIIGYAEIGWTNPDKRNWEGYKKRVGTHGRRLEKMDINFYKSPLIPWVK